MFHGIINFDKIIHLFCHGFVGLASITNMKSEFVRVFICLLSKFTCLKVDMNLAKSSKLKKKVTFSVSYQ